MVHGGGGTRRGWAVGALVLLPGLIAACGESTPPGGAGTLSFAIVSGDLQSAPAGSELPQTLVARVTNADGNPVQGQVVNFRVVAGGGSVFAGSGGSNANGVVQERWTLGREYAVDTQRVEARAVDPDTGEPIVFGVFRAIAGPPLAGRIIRVDGPPPTVAAGQPVEAPPTVIVENEFGASVPHVPLTFTVTAGGGAVSAAAVTSGSLPEPRASVAWTLGPAPGRNVLEVTRPGYTSAVFEVQGQ